jgi:hypothetical protein
MVKRNTFSILFFVHRSKKNKDWYHPVYCRLTVQGKSREFSTQVWVANENWNASAGKIIGTNESAKSSNNKAIIKVKCICFQKEKNELNISDRLILFLNKQSNNYGQDWTRGVVFTLSTGLMFYVGFVLCRDGVALSFNTPYNFILNDNSFWAGFINYIWLPNGFNNLIGDNGKSISSGFIGTLSFLIGKVLIAYGIYQTIAAFRKFI